MTAEQQQQLLADSSALLQANLSGPARPLNRTAARHNCVQAGSRMIEIITKVITPILFTIIIVVGLISNILVMWIIIEDRKSERELSPTNLLILDLSLGDLSFIIFCVPFTGWDYLYNRWDFGLVWCKINQYLIVVCALSSIYTLVLMSVDRFMAIVYPIECMSYRTSRNMLHAIHIKWILILLIASPTIVMHGLVESPLGPDQYACRFLGDRFNPLHFQGAFFFTSYLLPVILILCLYTLLLIKLWYGNKPHGHRESLKMLESKRRVTWLVTSIIIIFLCCWGPIQVMLILMRLRIFQITPLYIALQVLAHTLGYTNSCINPLVYAFASESFHQSFKRSTLGRFVDGLLDLFRGGRRQNADGARLSQHQLPDLANRNNSTQYNQSFVTSSQEQSRLKHLTSSSYQNNGAPRRETPNLPLEPRDRILAPLLSAPLPTVGPASQLRTSSSTDDTTSVAHQHQPAQLQSIRATSATSIPSSSTGEQVAPAKQQLVARMGHSGNQISHNNEPKHVYI